MYKVVPTISGPEKTVLQKANFVATEKLLDINGQFSL